MTDRDAPTADRHKANPIPFRPPEGDRAWLLRHAKATGRAVNAILRQALAEYRTNHDPDSPSKDT